MKGPFPVEVGLKAVVSGGADESIFESQKLGE